MKWLSENVPPSTTITAPVLIYPEGIFLEEISSQETGGTGCIIPAFAMSFNFFLDNYFHDNKNDFI